MIRVEFLNPMEIDRSNEFSSQIYLFRIDFDQFEASLIQDCSDR